MKAFREKIGDVSVLFQTMDEDVNVINDAPQNGPDLIDTGIEDEIKGVYSKAKLAIKSIAEDVGNELNNFQTDVHPKQMEIEFNIGFSAKADVWILGAKSDYALKVTMTWAPKTNG